MAIKIDHAETAKQIVELVGGKENVDIVSHCMTRLRFNLKDSSKVQKEEIKKIKGVLGLVEAGGQLQIILGENVLGTFQEVLKQNDFKDGGSIDENLDAKPEGVKGILKAVVDYVAAAVGPLVPGLVAGGLLKVLLLLIGLAVPSFTSSQTNTILGYVANAPFYFMPIFVAYGGARKLNATPAYAMLVAAALLTPGWASMVSALKAEGVTAASVFGIPALAVTYNNSLLPALFIAAVAAYVEKLLNKIIPGIFRSLLVGMCTIFITGVLAFTILGPFGDYVGLVIANVFIFLGDKAAPLAIGVLAMCLPWLIMFGMHHSISPFMASNIATIGYDAIIRPAFLLHNMCEGGSALGVALRAKDPEFKSQAFSLAFSAIIAGVTEPCIYGLTFKLKKPMIGVMAGGLAGGIVAGLLHVKAYVMGYSTILALPIFVDTMVQMAIAVVVGIAVSAAVTFIIGFDQNEAHL